MRPTSAIGAEIQNSLEDNKDIELAIGTNNLIDPQNANETSIHPTDLLIHRIRRGADKLLSVLKDVSPPKRLLV